MAKHAGASLPKRGLARLLAILLVVAPLQAQQPPAAPQPIAPAPLVQNLKVIPLAGKGEQNDLEKRVMAPLVVEVMDQNDRPVEGAEVVFRFPINGPGAAFPGGKPAQSSRTNAQGQAAAMNWTANNQVGAFDVHVTATYGNQIGETTFSMSNVTRVVEEPKKSSKRGWLSQKWVKVALIGGAAGVAAGIALALRGGGSSSGNTIIISPGSPGIGGPH